MAQGNWYFCNHPTESGSPCPEPVLAENLRCPRHPDGPGPGGKPQAERKQLTLRSALETAVVLMGTAVTTSEFVQLVGGLFNTTYKRPDDSPMTPYSLAHALGIEIPGMSTPVAAKGEGWQSLIEKMDEKSVDAALERLKILQSELRNFKQKRAADNNRQQPLTGREL